LLPASPAINAGDNNAPDLPFLDLDGQLRVIGLVVDMGPYESDVVTAIGDLPVDGAAGGIRSVHPNPFNPSTTIAFEIGHTQPVALIVYDVSGRQVRRLVTGVHAAGVHTAEWDASDDRGRPVASGVYFVWFRSSDTVDRHKIVLLK
jgi:hypothetical protein